MPIAVVDPTDYKRYELKSAPKDPNNPEDEDGYIYLRPLPYGMMLERQDETMKYAMEARRPQDRRQKKDADQKLPDIKVNTMSKRGSEIDFSYCIGDHNLTDKRGVKLDFANPLVFQVLDPRIAQEIQGYIDDLNNPEDLESAEDFIRRATSSPGDEQMKLSTTEVLNTE